MIAKDCSKLINILYIKDNFNISGQAHILQFSVSKFAEMGY